MSLPQDVINEIFSWVDMSSLYQRVYDINYYIKDKFKVAYFTSSTIGRATKQLFLKKKQLFEKYSIQFMIYKNISLTNIFNYISDKNRNTFEYSDNNLMLLVHTIQLNNGR